MRVGVIGVGAMGSNHVRVYSMLRSADLVGITDTDQRARTEVSLRFDVPAFADHHQLLREVQAVSVAVPTERHFEVVSDCLRSGVHVLVEKPLTIDVLEAEQLVRDASARGLVLQVGHIERFNPAVQELMRIVAGQRVLSIGAARLSPPTPRVRDVDVILDLMIHDLDIASQIAGSPVLTISAMGAAVGGSDLDLVMTHLQFASGSLANFVASKVAQQKIRELDVTTDEAFVTLNYRTRDLSIYRAGGLTIERPGSPVQYRQEAVIEKPLVESAEPLYLELEHFLSCIDGMAPMVTTDQALDALRLATQVRQHVAANRVAQRQIAR